MTLLQTLLGLFIGGLIATIVFQQLVTLFVGQQVSIDSNLSTQQTRQVLDTVADHLRGASPCTTTGAGVIDSVISTAGKITVTYYSDSACNTIRYWYSNGNLNRTQNGNTVTVVRNVTAVTFTYYKATTYNSPWTTTINPNIPTTAELPFVCGVLMDVTTNSNGLTSRLTTTIRFRNAPKKTNLSGM